MRYKIRIRAPRTEGGPWRYQVEWGGRHERSLKRAHAQTLADARNQVLFELTALTGAPEGLKTRKW